MIKKTNRPLVIALAIIPLILGFTACSSGPTVDGYGVSWWTRKLKVGLPSEKIEAIKALSEIRNEKSIEPLIDALLDEDDNVRSEAALALAEFDDKRAVEPLITSLKDKYPLVRKNAAYTLGILKHTQAVEHLIPLLDEKSESVANSAVFALGEIGDARAAEALINLYVSKCETRTYEESAISSMYVDVGVEAKEALIQIGMPAVEPLIDALKHENGLVRNKIADILERICPNDDNLGSSYTAWKNWWRENKELYESIEWIDVK
ncbi:hypothetical protein GF359_00660 [candidate division WOR-3 bacterium]|uniref:HEAT repeat domain-containing protein n=1 Tax=candidate division WOR-3 bacterium TaxID=2052148 RepID=A0A9D5QBP8_UNCW3|nr:hypothetical protein [candidate division WOR-3 bacterium]MBD3363704.1 hypothetical protein [candidate division WOR-3 bacterium]